MEYTDEQLSAKFKQLPEEIQAVIADQATEDKIFAVGQKFHLHVDKIGDLIDEVGLVLLGITKPAQFVNQLQQRLGIDQLTAEAIASEINTTIFLEIRDALKQLHNTTPASTSGSLGGPHNLPTKEEVLKEIENPPPVAISRSEPSKPSVFEQKMTQPFVLPASTSARLGGTTPPPNDNSPITDSGYIGVDPYREAAK